MPARRPHPSSPQEPWSCRPPSPRRWSTSSRPSLRRWQARFLVRVKLLVPTEAAVSEAVAWEEVVWVEVVLALETAEAATAAEAVAATAATAEVAGVAVKEAEAVEGMGLEMVVGSPKTQTGVQRHPRLRPCHRSHHCRSRRPQRCRRILCGNRRGSARAHLATGR